MTAPELAILGVLETAIDLAIIALVAVQPEIQVRDDGRVVISTAAADRADHVIVQAQALAAAILGYRSARSDDSDARPF